MEKRLSEYARRMIFFLNYMQIIRSFVCGTHENIGME